MRQQGGKYWQVSFQSIKPLLLFFLWLIYPVLFLIPLSHSVSHWFFLSASGLHEYLASPRTRVYYCAHAGSYISPPNPHLEKKKGFNQRVNFLPPSSPAQIQKYPSVSKNSLLYSRHTGGICCGEYDDAAAPFPFSDFSPYFLLTLFSFTLRRHQGQCDPGWREEGEEDGRFCKKKKGRQETSQGLSWIKKKLKKIKNRRGSDGLIYVLRPFLTLSSELSGGSKGSESWWVFVLYNNHQVCQQTHSLPILFFVLFPIYPIASLPLLSSPALSLFLSHWCDTQATVNLFLSITHIHTYFEFRPISANGTCSLCWLSHIFFHLNLKVKKM